MIPTYQITRPPSPAWTVRATVTSTPTVWTAKAIYATNVKQDVYIKSTELFREHTPRQLKLEIMQDSNVKSMWCIFKCRISWQATKLKPVDRGWFTQCVKLCIYAKYDPSCKSICLLRIKIVWLNLAQILEFKKQTDYCRHRSIKARFSCFLDKSEIH